ncbi:hypothetical protein HRbin40_01174 [bacterium HR40]|nr:hypothetical protein HRbin40_01174 [bacterium HR40]
MDYFLTYWYFHLPNYVLAAVFWTMLGRFLLGLFVPLDWDNFIWRFFRLLTDPVLALIRPLTFGLVPEGLLPLVAAFGLVVVRFAYWVLLFRLGWAPPLPGAVAS